MLPCFSTTCNWFK